MAFSMEARPVWMRLGEDGNYRKCLSRRRELCREEEEEESKAGEDKDREEGRRVCLVDKEEEGVKEIFVEVEEGRQRGGKLPIEERSGQGYWVTNSIPCNLPFGQGIS